MSEGPPQTRLLAAHSVRHSRSSQGIALTVQEPTATTLLRGKRAGRAKPVQPGKYR